MSKIRQEVLRMKLLSCSFDQMIKHLLISRLEIATDTVAKPTNLFQLCDYQIHVSHDEFTLLVKERTHKLNLHLSFSICYHTLTSSC